MAISITQIGGFTGSYSGDCCIIRIGDLAVIIDLGNQDMMMHPAMQNIINGIEKPERILLIITHMHDDHTNINNISQVNKLRNIEINDGKALIMPGKVVNNKQQQKYFAEFETKGWAVTQLASSDGRLFNYKDDDGTLCHIRVFSSAERGGYSVDDENDTSLGALVSVEGDKAYHFLTLGDMNPIFARDPVLDALNAAGALSNKSGKFNCFNVVKLAHHGSTNNLFYELNRYFEEKTYLISSGWSKCTDTNVWSEFLRNSEGLPKINFDFIVNSKSVAEECTESAFDANIRNFLNDKFIVKLRFPFIKFNFAAGKGFVQADQ